MLTIDLNCDMGEGFGPWKMGDDAALMPLISSANIACGYHGGDPVVMRDTVRLALHHGVAIGAHPGYPDLQGFGRRNLSLSPDEVYAVVLHQIGALQAIAAAEGGVLHHVKPHGALYNTAARQRDVAEAIVQAVCKIQQSDLILYGLSGSVLLKIAEVHGLRVCREAFCDRSYQNDGALTPRNLPGAVIDNPEAAAKRALQLAQQQSIETVDGTLIAVPCGTICIHGDGDNAVAIVRAVRELLEKEGLRVATPPFPSTP
ncbi:MAG: 5-oxoprolinase subunit PxpA [Saprospiraceae bacterium]|nr:5-oxoprolinase subunit PxpA [Saprospiraceae bacterium]MDZ4703889.1 5-oxoprolinase subunit PxpA [Saprospiraceae bacterium]